MSSAILAQKTIDFLGLRWQQEFTPCSAVEDGERGGGDEERGAALEAGRIDRLKKFSLLVE